MSAPVRTAFLLCAGHGRRLQPLTAQVPKPLVPICGIPLCGFALSRIAASGVERIVINTHRLAEEFIRLFPGYPRPMHYEGVPVVFRHEPVLLETAGGLKNIADLLLSGPVLVHNGDILADMDLAALFAAHARSGALCTLALRSSGGPLHVGFDEARGMVTDIRGEPGLSARQFLYTGVCVVEQELLARIPPDTPMSLVPVWLDVLRDGGKIAGIVLDGGLWRDIGSIGEYLRIHADLASGAVRLEPPAPHAKKWPCWRMPGVRVEDSAVLSGWSWIGPDAEIGDGARVENSVIWAGAKVEPHAVVRDSVVREGMLASGDVVNSVV